MARRAVVTETKFVTNDQGAQIVDPAGRPIRRVVWHWEDIPEPAPTVTPGRPAYDEGKLQALYEKHLKHGGLGVVAPEKPKRYRLSFGYADGQTRETEASVAEALLNEAIGRTLHSAQLIRCQTELIREA